MTASVLALWLANSAATQATPAIDRDRGEARDHQAEPARRALLLLQPQLLGFGQLPGLIQLALPGRFPGLPFGFRLGVAGFQKADRRLEIAAVLLGPFGIRRLLLAPAERDLEDRDRGTDRLCRRSRAGPCPAVAGRSAPICASSSTHMRSRCQPRIRLSCDRSSTVRSVSSTSEPGIRNVTPEPRKASSTVVTVSRSEAAIAWSCASRVGRRIPRLSSPFSVSVLKIFSQADRWRSSGSAS